MCHEVKTSLFQTSFLLLLFEKMKYEIFPAEMYKCSIPREDITMVTSTLMVSILSDPEAYKKHQRNHKNNHGDIGDSLPNELVTTKT